MQWVISKDDERLPIWLRSNLAEVCQYCGSPIENGYNDAGECTRRRCSNPNCPETIGQKIGKMCEVLNYAGVRGGVGSKIVRDYNLKTHFEAIPILYTSGKPRVTLSTYLRCACIYGIDAEFQSIAGDKSTVGEVFASYTGKYLSTLLEYKELLLSGEQYFDIVQAHQVEKRYPVAVTGDIVITGVIPGLANRDHFVGLVNAMYKGLTAFGYSKSRRKTGLYCCISQDKSATSGKANDAREGGFPILTVEEFFCKVNSDIVDAGYLQYLEEINRERGSK